MIELPEIPEVPENNKMPNETPRSFINLNNFPAWVSVLFVVCGTLFGGVTTYNKVQANADAILANSVRVSSLESKNYDFRIAQLESEFNEIKIAINDLHKDQDSALSDIRKENDQQTKTLNDIKVNDAGIEERLKFILDSGVLQQNNKGRK